MASLLRLQAQRIRAHRAPLFARHTSTAVFHDPKPLPPPDTWRHVFVSNLSAVRDRASVSNPRTANILARAFLGGKSIVAGKGKTVIESYPGPGALSRALLTLEDGEVEKLIILEEYGPYLEYLLPLQQADPRVTVIPMSGFKWETYNKIEEDGHLDHIKKVAYEEGMHPQLHFISHIPQSIQGEQFVAQLFRNIPTHSWLFKYGCVPMSFIMGEWIWERVAAIRKTSPRCKVSVIAEATADMQSAIRSAHLQPYESHFHPVRPHQQITKYDSRRIGLPLAAINILPFSDQVIEPRLLDAWDYCLRKLFVQKSTTVEKAMSGLGPGADSLTRALTNPALPTEQRVDVKQRIKDLNVADWALIVRAFDNWPFAPESLIISDAFLDQSHDRTL